VAPPFPDLLIASGRRAVPYVRVVRRGSGGRTFTVFLKDPRTGTGAADLIWVPEHDRLRGGNVLATLTPPHRVSRERLAEARRSPDARLGGLAHPRVAVLAGGSSRHHAFTNDDVERFAGRLASLAASGASLMVTASRRTPLSLQTALKGLSVRYGGFYWDGSGQNPYICLLALADAIVATANSFNMIGEAAATGVPILVFEPTGGHPKLRSFMAGLERYGAVHAFEGSLVGDRYEPLDSTGAIAHAIAEGLARHRRKLGLAAPASISENS
jgi:mitochondrial fission protein ELM1